MTKKIIATILVTATTITMLASCTSKDTGNADTGSSSQIQSSSKVDFKPTPITPTPPKKEEVKTDTPKTTDETTKPKVDKDVTIVIDKNATKNQTKPTVMAKKITVPKSPTISISKKTVSLVKGKTANIKAAASDKSKVAYSSSNPKIATISSSGKVTAIATGKAIITACISDSKNIKATCVVTVTSKTSNNNKPKQGDTKKGTDGKTYIYDSKIASLGVPEWDGWIEYDPNPMCDKCGKSISKDNFKCICQKIHDDHVKNWVCDRCGKKSGKCKCVVENATFS